MFTIDLPHLASSPCLRLGGSDTRLLDLRLVALPLVLRGTLGTQLCAQLDPRPIEASGQIGRQQAKQRQKELPGHQDTPLIFSRPLSPYGIQLRQRKSKRGKPGKVIKVAVVGGMRAELTQLIADNRKKWPDRIGIPLVVDPETGQGWPDWKFQRRFRALVNAAIAAATEDNNVDLVEDLSNIEFRDLRRSGMVSYFELGIPDHQIAAISGHSLERTKKILEVYGPRNTRMASGAVAQSVTRLETRRRSEAARTAATTRNGT